MNGRIVRLFLVDGKKSFEGYVSLEDNFNNKLCELISLTVENKTVKITTSDQEKYKINEIRLSNIEDLKLQRGSTTLNCDSEESDIIEICLLWITEDQDKKSIITLT